MLTILTSPQPHSPGLRAFAPSGCANYSNFPPNPWAKSFCPFRACGEKLAKLQISYRTSVHENVQFVRRILKFAEWYFFYQLSELNGSSSSFLNCPSSQMISPQLDGFSSGSCDSERSVHLGGEPAQMLQVSAMMVVVIGHIYLFFIVCRF